MSTEIKNTLFRFATMRGPELIEDEKINNLFSKHPESEKDETDPFISTFLDAAYLTGTELTKKERLANAASAFSVNAIKSVKELKENNSTVKFYDFATWLSKNRTKLTLEKLNLELQKLGANHQARIATIGGEGISQILWENLIYQILTSKSAYMREALLMLLAAEFFLKKQSSFAQTDEELRKLAQARIVIPNVILSKEASASSDSEQTNTGVSKELSRELSLLSSKEKIAEYQKSINELKREQAAYNKTEQKAYDSARKTYEKTIKAYYANAEIIQKNIIDSETNQEKTISQYAETTQPEFEYTKQPELEFSNSEFSRLADPTSTSLTSLLINSENYETYQEIITDLEASIEAETQQVFQNSDLSETLVNSNGVVLPVVTSATPSNSFAIGSVGYGFFPTMPLSLLFDSNFENKEVESASYTVTFADNTVVTGTTFETQLVNQKLFVKIFTNGLNLQGKTLFKLDGHLLLSDGQKINLKGTAEFHVPDNMVFIFVGYSVSGNGTYKLEVTGEGEGGNTEYIPFGYGMKRLGIIDYRKVEQEICCYVPGEVSHIENVMAREYKERSTRRLRRSENTTTTSKEKESEHLTDSTSTDRFEMNQEVSSVLAEDTHMGASVNGSYTYGQQDTTGVVSIGAAADYANNSSSEESNNQAITHAKEVTEKVLDRVIQKVKEERVSKIIEEFEENNKHGFDNREGEKHVSGVYRWVDKIYKNKVINYGKRLMYEFMIPQPAAFHLMATSEKKDLAGFEKIEKPIDPRTAKNDIALKLDATFDSRYKYWVALYNVETQTCPKQKLSVSKGFEGNYSKTGYYTTGQDVIPIPEGYEVNKAMASLSFDFHPPILEGSGVTVNIGNKYYNHQWYTHFNKAEIPFYLLGGIQKELAVAYKAFDCGTFSMTVVAECDLTVEAKQQWQLETFNAIIRAYEAKLEEYNAKMAQAKAMQGEKIRTNPLFYREIENTVLRKNCMEYISSHAIVGGQSLIEYGTEPLQAMNLRVKYDSQDLDTYASRVKFLEQAFEWNLLSYNLYPFYWAEKKQWTSLYNINDVDDATHKAFLQSGMARVIVTVRPGFEEAVNWYMATGQVWNGGQVPTVNDPLFLSIVDELRETNGEIEETWESRVPTSLTIIQAGEIGLEVDKALPCCEDRGDNPFGFKGNSSKMIEFTFQDMDGSGLVTIGEHDGEGNFPRIYKCMGQTITINRDAVWQSFTRSAVIFEKLADQLSLIPGIKAKIAVSNAGTTDGICFTVDTDIVKDFTFTKPGPYPQHIDTLKVKIDMNNNVIVTTGDQSGQYSDRVSDKSGNPILPSDVNALLPLSRFLV